MAIGIEICKTISNIPKNYSKTSYIKTSERQNNNNKESWDLVVER